jgi:Cft2 family RNA processing exonuclease
VGALPVALRHFPKAQVLMTELSYLLVERVLHNSVNVMTHQRDELGIKDYPLYTHDEVDEIAAIFQGFKYNREVEWGPGPGHGKTRSGATSPILEFYDQTILKGARFEDVKADVMIMETTRGNRENPPGFSRENEIERLVTAIHAAQKKKGCVMIPAFALGRTQEILALLALLMRQGRLREQPIYIGGLGRVFTEIYDIEAYRTHRQHTALKLNEALRLIVLEKGAAETMKLTGGKIFVITAGMMSENTAAHDLAARMIGDERQSIFFVGYADPDSPAGRLRAAKPGETFVFSPRAGRVTRNCELQEFDLTAHANRGDLLEFVGQVSPRVVLLGHGDDSARAWFAEQIRSRWPKIQIFQPEPLKGVAG